MHRTQIMQLDNVIMGIRHCCMPHTTFIKSCKELMMTKPILTQARLKELLEYSPNTGAFTWVKTVAPRARAGDKLSHVTKEGYPSVKIEGCQVKLHRLAFLYMTGIIPKEVDHINGVKLDNSWRNLRGVTHQDNIKNSAITKRNKTGVMGVYMDKMAYKVQIGVDGVQVYVGRYADFFEACCARKSAELKHEYHSNHGRAI